MERKKKKVNNPDLYIQQKYLSKDKGKKKTLFRQTKAEKIHCSQTCVIRNVKGNYSERSMIPDRNLHLH